MLRPANHKRKILHLRTISGLGGGPEKTLLASAQFLHDDFDVRLAYLRPAGDQQYNMPQRAEEAGATLIDIPESGPLDPRSLLKLYREIKAFGPDLLHPHDYKTNALSVVLGRLFGIPVVTTLHGFVTLGGRLDLYYRIDRWAIARMHHAIAVSGDLYEHLVELNVPDDKRTLIENGIDLELYQRKESPYAAKIRLGFDPDVPVIGAVGRLYPEKGFENLIKAVARIVASGQQCHLVIIGEGEHRAVLEQQVGEYQLDAHVTLVGHQDQDSLIAWYQAMDLFVLSSLREGLPNVLLEAMALQVPVVATSVGGVPALISDEADGLLVEPDSDEQLAGAIQRMLTDAPLRTRLAAGGHAVIEQRYCFRRRMERIVEVYDRILSQNSKAGTSR